MGSDGEETHTVPFWPPGDFTMGPLGFHDGQIREQRDLMKGGRKK